MHCRFQLLKLNTVAPTSELVTCGVKNIPLRVLNIVTKIILHFCTLLHNKYILKWKIFHVSQQSSGACMWHSQLCLGDYRLLSFLLMSLEFGVLCQNEPTQFLNSVGTKKPGCLRDILLTSPVAFCSEAQITKKLENHFSSLKHSQELTCLKCFVGPVAVQSNDVNRKKNGSAQRCNRVSEASLTSSSSNMQRSFNCQSQSDIEHIKLWRELPVSTHVSCIPPTYDQFRTRLPAMTQAIPRLHRHILPIICSTMSLCKSQMKNRFEDEH